MVPRTRFFHSFLRFLVIITASLSSLRGVGASIQDNILVQHVSGVRPTLEDGKIRLLHGATYPGAIDHPELKRQYSNLMKSFRLRPTIHFACVGTSPQVQSGIFASASDLSRRKFGVVATMNKLNLVGGVPKDVIHLGDFELSADDILFVNEEEIEADRDYYARLQNAAEEAGVKIVPFTKDVQLAINQFVDRSLLDHYRVSFSEPGYDDMPASYWMQKRYCQQNPRYFFPQTFARVLAPSILRDLDIIVKLENNTESMEYSFGEITGFLPQHHAISIWRQVEEALSALDNAYLKNAKTLAHGVGLDRTKAELKFDPNATFDDTYFFRSFKTLPRHSMFTKKFRSLDEAETMLRSLLRAIGKNLPSEIQPKWSEYVCLMSASIDWISEEIRQQERSM